MKRSSVLFLLIFLGFSNYACGDDIKYLDRIKIKDKLVSFLKNGEYDKSNSLINSYFHNQRKDIEGSLVITELYKDIIDEENIFDIITKWCESPSATHSSHYLKGLWYLKKAWRERGGAWASLVTKNGWNGFVKYLKLARKSLEKSYIMNEKDPHAASAMITVCMGENKGSNEVDLWFNRAIESEPHFYAAYWNKAWSMYPRWGGNLNTLSNFMDPLVEDVSNESRLYLVKLNWYIRDAKESLRDVNGENAISALKLAERFKKEYPLSARSRLHIAELAWFQKNREKAIKNIEESVLLNPNPVNYDFLSTYLYKSNRHEEAVNCLSNADKLGLMGVRHWATLGRINQFGLEKYEKAIRFYTKSLEIHENQPIVLRLRGNVNYRLKRYEKAVHDYNLSISLRTNYAKAYYGRGKANYKLKKYNEAKFDLKKSLKFEKDYGSPWKWLGRVEHYGYKDYARAIECYTECIELGNDLNEAHRRRGYSFMKLGLYSDAIKDFDISLKDNPKDSKTLLRKGECYQHLNR